MPTPEMTRAKRRVERSLGLHRVYAQTHHEGTMRPFVAYREIWAIGDGGQREMLGRGITWTEAADDAIRRADRKQL